MAGYIMNLDNKESLKYYAENGVYGTVIPKPRKKKTGYYWREYHEGAFADYATMQPGDNIYFFIQRKLYGIGRLVSIDGNCKYNNYPDSDEPSIFNYDKIRSQLLLDEGEKSAAQRYVCFFEADPCFFEKGVDMDDALESNPQAFRMLRAFWKLSFIKVDDEENQALKDIILKTNQDSLQSKNNLEDYSFTTNIDNYHRQIKNKDLKNYKFNIEQVLYDCADDNYIKHEMALETGILHQLSTKEKNTIKTFGEWDYLSHQVIASPAKPVDYMDKMDIFGYSYIENFRPTRSKYLVCELKRGTATKDDVEQLLKYVDFIKEEYAHGDYSMINAFLVAYDFPREVINYTEEVAERKYVVGRRPPQSKTWSNLTLIKYSYNQDTKLLDFQKVGKDWGKFL